VLFILVRGDGDVAFLLKPVLNFRFVTQWTNSLN
jgi:hypothetical protein